jgi:hypothetical protein
MRELHDLYSLSYVSRMMNSSFVGWTERVGRMGENRIACKVIFSLMDSGLWPVSIHKKSDSMNLTHS